MDAAYPGRVTVLLVEGNQKVRGDIHRALETRGFRVVSAWDAQDVFGFLATHEDPIEAALVDTTMMDGERELLRVLQEKRPGIRILLAGDPAVAHANGYEVIERPFEVADVVDRLVPLARGRAPG